MSGFYNYDTRGASVASQIIWFEGELTRLREENERLRNAAVFAWAELTNMTNLNTLETQVVAETLRAAIWPRSEPHDTGT